MPPIFTGCSGIFIKKAFEIHFDTNESDRKFILLERRFDVILHHFQVQLKFVIFKCS